MEKSNTEAVKWYHLAAEQGHIKAQYNLGVCYENGDGVEKSYIEAAKWYKLAAEKGHADAQCNLGYFYENGYGVETSFSDAAKWYKMAAEQGHAECLMVILPLATLQPVPTAMPSGTVSFSRKGLVL